MRLVYLYNHSGPPHGVSRSIPWSLSLQALGWDTIDIPLHEPETLRLLCRSTGCGSSGSPEDLALALVETLTPSVVLLDEITTFSPALYGKLRAPHRLVVGCGALPIPSSISLSGIDVVASSSPIIRQAAIAQGARAVLELIIGIPLETSVASPEDVPSFDVVFAGSIREPHAVPLLLELSKGALGWHGGFTLGYYTSEQVNPDDLPIGVAMHLQQSASLEELQHTIRASRIALWLGHENTSQYALERELFPVAATGTPIVARANTGAERFLVPNQEVITFASQAELLHNVRALLDAPEKRSALGHAAKVRIHQKYPLSASAERLSEALHALLVAPRI